MACLSHTYKTLLGDKEAFKYALCGALVVGASVLINIILVFI